MRDSGAEYERNPTRGTKYEEGSVRATARGCTLVCECTLMITEALPEAEATTAVLNSELQLRWM
jgi:hypothetical protein